MASSKLSNESENGAVLVDNAEAVTEAAAEAAVESVIVEAYITVRDLATLMDRSPIDLIKVLMQYGIMAPITHSIDHDTAVILGEELGISVEWPETEEPELDEEEAEAVEEVFSVQRDFVEQVVDDRVALDLDAFLRGE